MILLWDCEVSKLPKKGQHLSLNYRLIAYLTYSQFAYGRRVILLIKTLAKPSLHFSSGISGLTFSRKRPIHNNAITKTASA